MRGNEVACASSLPARFELQEAEVWARCVELTAAVPGNPLGAVVGHEGSVPLAALTAAASGALNRVIALGVPSPSSKAAVDRVVEFFERVEQDCFQVELAPIAAPPALGDWLQGAGLLISPETVTKVWRDLEGFDLTVDDVDVRKLTARDADQVAGLNVRAWGAWQQPSLHSWFAATVGQDGFTLRSVRRRSPRQLRRSRHRQRPGLDRVRCHPPASQAAGIAPVADRPAPGRRARCGLPLCARRNAPGVREVPREPLRHALRAAPVHAQLPRRHHAVTTVH